MNSFRKRYARSGRTGPKRGSSGSTTVKASNHDGWDWPYILYVGRVWLRYTDAETWALTPRQFKSQLDVHEDVTRQMYGASGDSQPASQPLGFIDQIKGW